MSYSLKVLEMRKKGFKYHVNWGLLFFMRFDDYLNKKKKYVRKGCVFFIIW